MDRSEHAPSSSGEHIPTVMVSLPTDSTFGQLTIQGMVRYQKEHQRWRIIRENNVFPIPRESFRFVDAVIGAVLDDERMEHLRVPSGILVNVTSSFHRPDLYTVCVNNKAIGKMAADYLTGFGHSRMAVFNRSNGIHMAERSSVFIQEVRKQKVEVFEYQPDMGSDIWATVPDDANHGRSALRSGSSSKLSSDALQSYPEVHRWLDSLPKPIAIFAACDHFALTISEICWRLGLRIPDDVALLGVDDDPLIYNLSFDPISSIIPGFDRVGYEAARMVDDLLNGRQPKARRIEIDPVGVAERYSTDVRCVDDRELSDALGFIRDHACDPCDVDEVAEAAGTARRYLQRRFREVLGRTIKDEIRRRQVEHGADLLLTTDLKVLAIAMRCGFSSEQGFAKAFSGIKGMSPARYRSRHRPLGSTAADREAGYDRR